LCIKKEKNLFFLRGEKKKKKAPQRNFWGGGGIIMAPTIINHLHKSILLCGQEAYRRKGNKKEKYIKNHLAFPTADRVLRRTAFRWKKFHSLYKILFERAGLGQNVVCK